MTLSAFFKNRRLGIFLTSVLTSLGLDDRPSSDDAMRTPGTTSKCETRRSRSAIA